MKKALQVFSSIVHRIENDSTPLRRYIYFFFAILTIRLCLEFFSNHRLFTIFDVLHIGLWFLFVVLAFLIQLHLFSGEQITKTIKLSVTCFTIALTAPILDIVLAHGYHFKMNYLSINSLNDLAWSYATIGGSSLTRGATPGIRIEIVLLMIGCFQYVYLKKNSFFRAFVATIFIYTILFFSGAVPFLLGRINNVFQLRYTLDDQSTILFLFTLDLILLSGILFIKWQERIRETVKEKSFLLLLITIPYFVFGSKLATKNYPENWTLNPTTLYWFPLLAFLFLIFHIYYTSIHKTPKNNNYYLQNTVLFFLIAISSIISMRCLFSTMIVWSLLFLLFEAPAYLCRVPYFSSILKSTTLTAFSILGYTTFGGPMVSFDTTILLSMISIGSFFILLLEKLRWKFPNN